MDNTERAFNYVYNQYQTKINNHNFEACSDLETFREWVADDIDNIDTDVIDG